MSELLDLSPEDLQEARYKSLVWGKELSPGLHQFIYSPESTELLNAVTDREQSLRTGHLITALQLLEWQAIPLEIAKLEEEGPLENDTSTISNPEQEQLDKIRALQGEMEVYVVNRLGKTAYYGSRLVYFAPAHEDNLSNVVQLPVRKPTGSVPDEVQQIAMTD